MRKDGFSMTVMAALVLVMGLLVLVAGCGVGSQSSPEATVAAFMKAVEDKDSDKALELAGSGLAEVSFDAFESMTNYTIGDINNLSDVESIVNVNIEMEEDGMKMNADFIFPVYLAEGKWVLDYHGIDIDWDKLNMGFDADDLEFEIDYEGLEGLDADFDPEAELEAD